MRYSADQYKLIKESGSFDTEWYVRQYPDVDELKMDPIEHYLWIGARMKRNPSADFDTSFYLKTYPEVAESGMNPLFHYISYGREQGRTTLPPPGERPKPAPVHLDLDSRGSEEELKQENELLLLQLHQVQEELEKYYLKYQELKNKNQV